MYRIGVDLGGTNIAVGLVNEENEIVCRTTVPTRAALSADTVIGDIADCIRNALVLSGADTAECCGVGVGTPGKCGADGVVFHAHNLGWEGVALGAMLRAQIDLPVTVRNDADCAALGEVAAGAAKGSESALLLTLGTGIGGGLIINGEIFSGRGMLGGEFGHMCIAMDGEECSCGQRGCWEAYASATALIRQAEAAAAAHPESLLSSMGAPDGEKIYAAAAQGDAAAMAVTAKYAEYVGVGLVNLINALYPEVVLIGGGVSGAGEALLAPLRDYAAAHYFLRGTAPLPEIRPAALGGDAGIIGAAALADDT